MLRESESVSSSGFSKGEQARQLGLFLLAGLLLVLVALAIFGAAPASAQVDGDTVCTSDGDRYVWQDGGWTFMEGCTATWTPTNPVEGSTGCGPNGDIYEWQNGDWVWTGIPCDPSWPTGEADGLCVPNGLHVTYENSRWTVDGYCEGIGLLPPESGDTVCSAAGLLTAWQAGEWVSQGACEPGVWAVPQTTSTSGRFVDDDGSIFEPDIEWLAASGITKGCGASADNLFCPHDIVTRGQMAAFLHRALPNLPEIRPAIDFTDDDESIFGADIEWLYSRGVTQGNSATTFAPDRPVTRGQMAAFLVRALKYSDNGGGDLFIDDDTSQFEGDIDRLGTAGVTRGCNPPTNDRFCPDGFVTRGQMAAFLHRALGG